MIVDKEILKTRIDELQGFINENRIFIKREDLIPFSFGGNKVRKAYYFFKDIEEKKCDYVITYGSASSNHCRIISNICSQKGLKCTIISTQLEENFNREMCKIFNAEIVVCKIEDVKETIEKQLKEKREEGYNPYFIQGGGHGNIGTKAYVDAYEEIKEYEEQKKIKFDYIFHASGTGTTQAGLIIGNSINNSKTKIIGISIARKSVYGKEVIIHSINDYMQENNLKLQDIEKKVELIDEYILDGYGTSNKKVEYTIIELLKEEGIPLDTTYTGKAFWGMKEFLMKNDIKNKNILFLHTGGTPIFFDFLRREL